MSEGNHFDDLNDIFENWEAHASVRSAPVSAPSVDVIGELCDAVRRNGSVSLSQNDVDKLRSLYDHLHGSKENAPRSVGAVQEKSVTSSANVVNDNIMGPMVLDTLDGFFMIIDDSAMVEYVTPNVQKYLDIAQNDIINKSVYNLIVAQDRCKFTNLFANTDEHSQQRHQIAPFHCQFAHSTQAMCRMHVTAMRSKSTVDDASDNMLLADDDRSCVVCVVRRMDDVDAHDNDALYQQSTMPRSASTTAFSTQYQRPQNLNLPPMSQQQMMYGPMSAPAMSSMNPQSPYPFYTPQPTMMMVPGAMKTPRFLLTCDVKGNIISVDPRYLSPDMPVTPLIVALQKRNIMQICHANDLPTVKQMLTAPSELMTTMSIYLNPTNLLTVKVKTVRVNLDPNRISVFIDCIATKQEVVGTPPQMQAPNSMPQSPMMPNSQNVTSSTPMTTYAQQQMSQQFVFAHQNGMQTHDIVQPKIEPAAMQEFKPKQARKRKPAQPKIDPETGEPIPPKRRQRKAADGSTKKAKTNPNAIEQPNPNAAIIDDDHTIMIPSTSQQQWTHTASAPMMTQNPMITGPLNSPVMQSGYCLSPMGQPVDSPIRMNGGMVQQQQHTTPQLIKLLQTAPSAPLEPCNLAPVPKRAQRSQNSPLVMNTGVADRLRAKGASTGKPSLTQKRKDAVESPQAPTPSTPTVPNMFVPNPDMPSNSAPPIGIYQQHPHGQPIRYQPNQYPGQVQAQMFAVNGQTQYPVQQYHMLPMQQQQQHWQSYQPVGDISQPQMMVVQPPMPFSQTMTTMAHDLPDSSSYDQPVDQDLQPSTFDLGLGGSFDMSHESTRNLVERFLL